MIPLLDWREHAEDPEGFAKRLGAVCREHGFFLLEGHGLPPSLISDLFDRGDAFFALPEEEKTALAIDRSPHNRGWAAMGSERLDEASALQDRKEAFNIGLDLAPDDPRVLAGEPFRGVNVWPPVEGFREAALAYFDAAWRLGVALLDPVARDLGLPPGW
ncbi:MAG: 2-oxoglutarate and iron-dependent oxygenase domain-containing protein, partial [Pseudomonadota bacterium]